MRLRTLLKTAYKEFKADKAARLGAALAYYTAFSLAPLLLVVLSLTALIYHDPSVRANLIAHLSDSVGGNAATFVSQLLQSSSKNGQGFALAVSIIVTLLGALGVFTQMKDAANTIWKVTPNHKNGLFAWLHDNLFSLALLLASSFLLLASIILSTVLSAFADELHKVISIPVFFLQTANILLLLGIVFLLFSLLLKYLPDRHVSWKSVRESAFITVVLFAIGNQALSLYLSHSGVGSSFGAAGSLAVILTWLYYASQIMLFGVELSKVLEEGGSPESESVPPEDEPIEKPSKFVFALGVVTFLLGLKHRNKSDRQ